jgi:hypothetical protein
MLGGAGAAALADHPCHGSVTWAPIRQSPHCFDQIDQFVTLAQQDYLHCIEQRSRELGQAHCAQIPWREPSHVDRLVAVRLWSAIHNVRIKDSRNVANKIAVRVAQAELWSAGNTANPLDENAYACLLACLAHGRFVRRFVGLYCAADRLPQASACLAHE